MRSCLIADALATQGATVTWWASTLDHKTKTFIAEPGHVDQSRPGVEIRLLHGRPYTKNVSLRRLLHEQDVARDFRRRAAKAPPPDLILASLPSIDLADAATVLAARLGVPSFVDFRDLWPEVFLDVSPLTRALTRIAIEPNFRKARRALSRATGIISITPKFLDEALALAGRARRPADRAFVLAYPRPCYREDELQSAVERWRARGLRLDGSETILCYFGVLSEFQMFDAVLEGVTSLDPAVRQRLRIVLCGHGSWLEKLRGRAVQDVPELLVPGHVDGPDIAVLISFAKAGLLLYPNRKDYLISYPNKVGEYLSGGLPILSSLGGESERLLREKSCGIYVALTGVEWANGLLALFADEDRYRLMRENARRAYDEIFDADHVYNAWAQHLMDYLRLGREAAA
jgi:glycosyltransferase involved in cell wall biosynthesis